MRGPTVRVSTIALIVIVGSLLAALFALKDILVSAHIDRAIQHVSSDGASYFAQYEKVWDEVPLRERPLVLLTGTPIVLMKIAHGELLLVLIGNLLLMGVTLRAALNSLPSLGPRLAFLLGALIFPYFGFGFLSLNKEVYAMCSAIWFGSYWLSGKKRQLWISVLLGAAARYYMGFAILFLAIVFPRRRRPRHWLAAAALLVISIVAPLVKSRIPGYSSTNVLDGAGTTSLLFAAAVDYHLYGVIYPIKYLSLIPARIYSLAIGLGRPSDPMEAAVSALTLALLLPGLFVLIFRRSRAPTAVVFVLMALLSPIPIMWTDIAHWRYFSYVYFFLLFAAVFYFFRLTIPVAHQRR